MFKPVIYQLDYLSNLHPIYQKLIHLPGFVLLESSDKSIGRYDIVSALPYERIKLMRSSSDIRNHLDYLNTILAVRETSLDLPFQGGAIGYVSYDLGAQLAGIHSAPQAELDEMPLLDFALYDWALIADHQAKTLILFSANTQPDTGKIIQQVKEALTASVDDTTTFTVDSDFKSLISETEYKVALSAIQKELQAGRSYQVNFTQAFQAPYTGDAWLAYKNISLANPVPFAAFMRTDDADVLSFSPERFLLYDKGALLTSPIKGTVRRSADPAEDQQLKTALSLSAKNRAENVMIVDLLRNDLGRISQAGTVKVSRLCALESYNSVHHLVSDIEGRCREDISPFAAFMSCFPGGSITGAPKLETMRIIDEQEQFARGIYCGSIGYFSNHGRFETNIAIRTITAKNNMLHLAAGGGITVESDADDEYQECYTKLRAIFQSL